MSSESNNRRSPARIRLPLWAVVILLLVLVIVVSAGGVLLFNAVRNMAAASANELSEFTPVVDENDQQPPASGPQEVETESEPLPVIVTDELEPWSGSERINILFLGTDQRCEETGPNHSDTFILASIDPQDMSGLLLSIPRDLWVEIPGFGVDRINQAYYFGQIYEYPGGGLALAQETLETLLGIPVDYFVTVDFRSFEEAVDLIGGIVIDVPEGIDDPDYPDNCYGYEPFSIEAGKQRLDGTGRTEVCANAGDIWRGCGSRGPPASGDSCRS